MLLNCGVGEDSWESLGLQGDPRSDSLKRPWCWERLKAWREGDNRGWDDWMASATRWTWVWISSRSWSWIGKPGMLQSMESQRVGHDWVTELNWQVYPFWPPASNSHSPNPHLWAYLVPQMVKNRTAVQEIRVRSLGWEDPLQKRMATHSSILAWRIPQIEKPGGLQSTRSKRVRHD